MKYRASSGSPEVDLHLDDPPAIDIRSMPLQPAKSGSHWIWALLIGMCIGGLLALASRVYEMNRRLDALEKRIPVPAEATKP